MDGWQVAQNYIVAGVIFGGLGGYYYYTTKQRTPNRTRASTSPVAKRGETDARARAGSDRRVSARERDAQEHLSSSDNNAASSFDSPVGPRKRKVRAEQAQPDATATKVTRDGKPEKEADTSTAQFARQMLQARQGANLATSKGKESRVKTVKARPTEDVPVVSSTPPLHNGTETEAEADDEAAPTTLGSGDVADMLEPSAPGPSSLRITAPSAPQKEKSARQPKAETAAESKKQRQNRKKVEERRLQREEEEKERKALEEKQRRSARQARGEPAKNGVAVAKPPVSNPWEQKNAANAAQVQSTVPAVTGQSHGPLLDTFDAESTGSSNGGMGASTAATSTTEGEQSQRGGNLSEEEQVAAAIQQSGDLSGWTTVSAPKKSKKRGANDETPAAVGSTENYKPISQAKPPTNTGKANGFLAFQTDSSDGIEWEA